jgi:hypothetical protein
MKPVQSIADWMTTQNLGIEELLQRSALDRKVLQAMIEGRYTPSPQQRLRLALALGVSVEQVLWGHTAQVDHMYGHGPQFGRSP